MLCYISAICIDNHSLIKFCRESIDTGYNRQQAKSIKRCDKK